MSYLLEDLVINRVDLVDEGANSEAFISLYKRKEPSNMDVKEILMKMTPEHASVVQAEIDRLAGDITKANDNITTLTTEKDATAQDLAKAKEELDAIKAEQEEEEKKKKEDEDEKDEEEIIKSMPETARNMFAKMKEQKEAAEEKVRKAKEQEEENEAVAKAQNLKALPIEQEKLVGVLKNCSPEILEVLTSVNKALVDTTLTEVGKSNAKDNPAGTAAWDAIENKAAEIAKSKGLSKAKAISQAVEENPDLYKEYLEGGAN